MLHSYVRVTVSCDGPGCEQSATRVLTGDSPRALLAAVRRSLRRRDGWQLTTPLFGAPRDLCPACQLPTSPTQIAGTRDSDAGLNLVTERAAQPEPEPAPTAARGPILAVVPQPGRTAASEAPTQILMLPPKTATVGGIRR